MNKKNSFKTKNIQALAVIMVLGFMVFPSKTLALTTTPLRFEVSGDPGSVIEEKMTLINESPVSQTFYSSFANFESKGDTGIPNFVAAKDDLGTWISLPNSIVVSAGGSMDIPVRITVPKDATPGGHFASIFWGTQPPASKSSQVSVGIKSGLLVLLSVNGNVAEKAGITEFNTITKSGFFKALPINFYYRFQNNGGDRIKPVGSIAVKNMIGMTTTNLPGNPVDGNILPNSTRKIETFWAGQDGKDGVVPPGFFDAAKYEFNNFAFGFYNAHLDLKYGKQDNHSTFNLHLWIFPWELSLFVFVILLIIVVVFTFLIRRYNKWVIARAEKMFEEHEARMEHVKNTAVFHKVVGPKIKE